MATDCRFAEEKCHNCGRVGHIKQTCEAKANESAQREKRNKEGTETQDKKTHLIQEEESSEDEVLAINSIDSTEEVVTVYNMEQKIAIPREEPMRQTLGVNGMKVNFEVDAGCGCTIMSEKV